MANAISNLNYSILSDAVFQGYTSNIVPLSSFSLDVSPRPQERGTSVQALYVPLLSDAIDFVAANGYQMQDSNAQSVTVTLDYRRYVSTKLTDVELTNYPQISLEAFGKAKGFSLAKNVFQTILGGFQSGSGNGQYAQVFPATG